MYFKSLSIGRLHNQLTALAPANVFQKLPANPCTRPKYISYSKIIYISRRDI